MIGIYEQLELPKQIKEDQDTLGFHKQLFYSNYVFILREECQSRWYSQAFEKPGQAQATWPPNLSFVSPNPVTIQYLPINITWASGGPSPAK